MRRIITFTRCVALTLWACAALAWLLCGIVTADLVDRIVVVVNDDIILLSDLEQMLSSVQSTLDDQGYPKAEQERILNSRRDKILEKMIYDKLTDQQVARHNIKVKDEDVDATINRIRAANKLSEEQLRRELEMDGMTYDAYRTQIKENMLRARLLNREVKSKIVITDVDIKAFYDAHPEKYAGSTKYNLRHILLRVPGHADQKEKTKVLDQMNAIRERLEAGEPFEELAKAFSEAPTASQGGQLGIFGTHLLTKEIGLALKGLQAKQFSQPVETDQGYQIFYVEDIVSTGGTSLADATLEIREKLYADVVDKKFNTWIEDLRKRSHIQILDE
jgi:peptidyl-prolyl cis-trans isomerase SurA